MEDALQTEGPSCGVSKEMSKRRSISWPADGGGDWHIHWERAVYWNGDVDRHLH